MNRTLMVLLAGAAILVGVLLLGACGSKETGSKEASSSRTPKEDPSTTTQQQGSKGDLDAALEAAQTTPVKPNIVFILTDDMRKVELKYMPKTRALLETKGRQFENAFVSTPPVLPL